MRPTDSKPDVVIVGAGIAGSALAMSLAGFGHSVMLLEKSTVHVERVRGEFIVPWGVAEARALGILDVLENAGANYTVRSIPYGEELSPEDAPNYPVPMDQMVPGVQGALNLGHPRICNALNAAAIAAGAALLRGVDRLQVRAGLPPRIEFTHSGSNYSLSPRIVIGADGRGSAVARQVGFERLSDPIHHLLTGLLVDDFGDWPHDEQSMGVDGDLGFYIFPQGGGRSGFTPPTVSIGATGSPATARSNDFCRLLTGLRFRTALLSRRPGQPGPAMAIRTMTSGSNTPWLPASS
jgi:menaquinone-9 beta-reductase